VSEADQAFPVFGGVEKRFDWGACVLTAWLPRQQQHSSQDSCKQAHAVASRPNWLMHQHQHSWANMNTEMLLLRPNWLMHQHQHNWANMNKELLLLDPTGLCISTSTVGQT
jgi:hypothetical protein